MTSFPPTEDPTGDQHWEQPRFDEPTAVSGPVLQPGQLRPTVPPPGPVETVIGVAAGVIWPIMIVLGVFTSLSLGTAIVLAIIASLVLNQVQRTSHNQRRASIQPPATPPLR